MRKSVFAICVEAIIYLLLHNLHDCTFTQELIEFYGVDWYIFEATGSKIPNARKLLYHLYKLCELVFETIKHEVHENVQVDLFYNGMLSECKAVSVNL